jgi:hypothetical protein
LGGYCPHCQALRTQEVASIAAQPAPAAAPPKPAASGRARR